MDLSGLETEQKTLPIIGYSSEFLEKGLPNFKTQTLPKHPVENIQINKQKNEREKQYNMLGKGFGSQYPLMLKLEEEIYNQPLRLPCLPSSYLSLEVFRGTDIEVEPEDLYNMPNNSPLIQPPVHQQMEQYLGMSDLKTSNF
ncbi:proteasome maturation protein [Anaeramoeba flamelloides]|uniref:Proteasome maturation protein n=1 Tax=Anaeramoeba flamelloides TaxID=1746091 RepID=A0ABQ8ZAW5_9EUKA|nr:proteasome maturation protein [Anaeramoeba flamelloides]